MSFLIWTLIAILLASAAVLATAIISINNSYYDE